MLIAAGGLWLSQVNPSSAATATNTQSVSATITNSISWGTAATCIQSTGAAAFGSLSPGASASAPGGLAVYTGCITSNSKWGVTATMTTAPTAGSEPIAAKNFRAEVATGPVGGTVGCPTGNSASTCTLNNASVPLVSEAPATPLIGTILTNGFTYAYKLNVPENQPAGSYTGGVITLTASN